MYLVLELGGAMSAKLCLHGVTNLPEGGAFCGLGQAHVCTLIIVHFSECDVDAG